MLPKSKNQPKIKLKSKVRKEGTKKIEDAQLHKLTQKRFLSPTITQKVDY